MFGFYLMVLLSPAAPDQIETESAKAANARAEPRGFHQINQDIRKLFRREAQADSNTERAQAVVEMTELYQEVRRDARYPNSKTLQGYKAKLWGRLRHIKEEIRKDEARQARRGGGSSQSPGAEVPTFFVPPAAARGGRAVPDWGPGLVALIERTIAPEFWDVNGGPGTIVYYYPLRVLVVRATSEVHHQIGGGLAPFATRENEW